MAVMNVCFVGIGSIAKRHIKNLNAICRQRGLELHIDAYRHRTDAVDVDAVEHSYHEISQVPDGYDAIFITNPTQMHLESLKAFHTKSSNFFIEKPVVSYGQLETAKAFKVRKEALYYVACPLRYHAVIQYVKNYINPDDVISVRSISSSYLPDWRPGQDYRKTYSAHKALGGGVSTDLIHEWDYLAYLFGWPMRICKFTGKLSDLEIDSDDYAIYIAEYENKIVELHLDYFGRSTIRQIQLITRDDTILGNIANNTIQWLGSGKMLDFKEGRDDCQRRELDYFIDMVLQKKSKESGFEQSLKVLSLAQGKQ